MKPKIVYQVSFVVDSSGSAVDLQPKVLRLSIKGTEDDLIIVGAKGKGAWGFDISRDRMGKVRDDNGRLTTYVYPANLAAAKKTIIAAARKQLRSDIAELTAKIADKKKRFAIVMLPNLKWIKENA